MKVDYSVYLCTNRDVINERDLPECVEEAILGGVGIVQIREKNVEKEEFIKVVSDVMKVTKKHSIPLIINDQVDIAIETNADGVHLGQSDMPCRLAREKLGKDKIIGITITNLEEATKAKEEGADYLGVGAMFKSSMKPEASLVSFEELKKIRDNIDLPIVVIGGININTITKFKGIQPLGYAMIKSILCSDNIVDNTKKIKKLVNSNNKINSY